MSIDVLRRQPARLIGAATFNSFGVLFFGVFGSLLMTLGSLGHGWVPLRSWVNDFLFVEMVRSNQTGRTISLLVTVVGALLLFRAWLQLGRLVRGRLISGGQVVLVTVAWLSPLLVSLPIFSRDVYSYFAQGRSMAYGFNPYLVGPSVVDGWTLTGADPLWSNTPSPYGPLSLWMQRGVVQISGEDPTAAVFYFRLLAVAGLAILVWGIWRIAQRFETDFATVMWLGIANPMVLTHFVMDAHNDSLMIGLAVASLALALDKRFWLAVVLLTAAASIKAIVLVFLPFIGLMWAGEAAQWGDKMRAWAKVAFLSLGGIALTGMVVGVGSGWILAMASAPNSAVTWMSVTTSIGLGFEGVLQFFGFTADLGIDSLFRALGLVVAVALCAGLVFTSRDRHPVRGAALAILAIVLFSPTVHMWYIPWFLPLLVATGIRQPWQLKALLVLSGVGIIQGMGLASVGLEFEVQVPQMVLAVVMAGLVVGYLLLLYKPTAAVWTDRGNLLLSGLLPAPAMCATATKVDFKKIFDGTGELLRSRSGNSLAG